MFVGNAKGFVRLNLAMPRAIIEKGLRRMSDAVHRHIGAPSGR
jgi:cystathionine beta-lyase